jgi:TonB-dependent SusC/RagA subfamily outer membrane receptor
MRNLVSWRNVPQIYLRVVRIDRALQESLGANSYADEYWQKLLQLPALKTFSQTLPETGDYLQHRTEIRIDALPAGDYALVVSSGKDFSLAGPILAVQYFSVSGIAYVNTGRDYFVVNRESGQPLAGAAVQIWNRAYEYKTYKFTLSKAETYTTDDHGHFLLKKRAPKDANIQQWLEISTAGDHLFPDGQSTAYYLRYQGNDENDPSDKLAYERKYRRTFFFTDRAIYRPGQTLYFKGIVVTQDKDSRQSKVQPSFQTRVRLLNANGELVDSLDMTTNAFGSYHGKFTLPGNGLNGEFSIADDSADGRRSFSVEEYKRPKFYVEYDKLKGGYRVGDTIRVTGNAKAYAGNLIDGAKVKYRVVRQARFPYPWLYWRWGRPAVSEQEIAHGEATTTTDGKFTVAFAAIPDRKVSKGLDPVFEYSISADVTDINGETRSGQTTVSVGYKAIQLAIDLPGGGQHIPADSLKQLTVRTTNLSGEPEPSAIHMTIYSLQSPDRMIRKRYWDMPDQFVINKKDYLEAFPHDEYQDETKVESWQRTGKVAERLDSSGAVPIYRGEFPTGMRTGGKVNDQRLLPGWYAIEVTTTDKYGAEVKDIKYVELYDGKTGQPAYPQYNWGVEDNILAEPGSNATVDIGSSAGNVFVIRKVDHTITGNPIRPLVQAGSDDGDAAGPFNFLTLSKERKTTALPVTEGDRGGFGVLDVFVKDNRVYTNAHTILVPWSNKELKIDYTSFRDKTQPGSQERWTVNISGYKGDRVAAEVLASMYDASLDQFKMQYWNKPDLYPLYYPGSSWMSNDNFSMVNSLQKYFPDLDNLTYVKQYDQLLTAASPGAAGGVRHMMNTERSSDALLYKSAAPAPLAVLNGRVPGLAVSGVAQEAVVIRGAASMDTGNQPLYIVDGVIQSAADAKSLDPKEIEAIQILKGSAATSLYGASAAGGVVIITTKKGGQGARQEVQVRKNFNETAFFFPDLQTDAAGNVSFSFTMPEALTNWRLLTLAHTRELAFGFGERTVVTQKQLMLQPNAPRFLREGDRMELSTKIVNLTDSEMTGQVALELIDPTTGQTADGLFSNRQPNQYFTVGARQSAVVSFPIDIPYQYNRPLSYRMIARARNYSDGEEAALPVVSNRMLVTETLPLNMPGNGSRSFKFDKLLQSGNSETLNNHALTVEFTGNPTWYAVQALPYLIEYPYECAEQIFGRFYANALATKIVNSSPRIKAIFEQWKTADTAALLSNLQKNQELKSVLLEETPWVLQAKSESQQKKNIALLFDMVRMSREMDAALNKLQDMQSPNGGFVWFKGGEDNRYITQYILTGIGHLKKLNAIPASATEKIRSIVDAALPYLDQQVKKEYEEIKKKSPGAGKIAGPIQGSWGLPIYYLYMRSFFSDHGIPGDVFPAVNYFRKQTQASWLQQNKYLQGMIALSLYRTGDIKTAKDIMASLRQNAIRSEELGMYWKGMEAGYYWYQAPVETQSLLIEAFREVSPDAGIDRDLKTWLLRQKQTRSWSTTKSTADACYALLAGGENWLNVERNVEVKLGSMVVSSAGGGTGAGAAGSGGAAGVGSAGATAAGSAGTGTVAGSGTEAGTGYFKRVIDGAFVQPSMGNITVTLSPVAGTNSGKNLSGPPAWGAIYWQYFDNLDRITPPGGTKAPLKLTKKLFIQKNTDRGPVLEPVSENGTLHVGDKVKVRIELQADRDMEFVHMKDMRAAGMEPVNVISQYKWQGGLGYYESTKDVSTNFFFSWLPKGTYVFEYELFVGQVGNFSNGVTNIECMYAPEFASHSEGIRVNVEAVNP